MTVLFVLSHHIHTFVPLPGGRVVDLYGVRPGPGWRGCPRHQKRSCPVSLVR